MSLVFALRPVFVKYFFECKSLRSVIFGASSGLERICVYAFCRTSIESCLFQTVFCSNVSSFKEDKLQRNPAMSSLYLQPLVITG